MAKKVEIEDDVDHLDVEEALDADEEALDEDEWEDDDFDEESPEADHDDGSEVSW